MKEKSRGSIQWRIVIICVLLVFAALSVVSVYLLRSMEDYQLSLLQDNIDRSVRSGNLLSKLEKYEDLDESQSSVQEIIDNSWPAGLNADVTVISRNLMVLGSSNSNFAGKDASLLFDTDIIISCIEEGETVSAEGYSGQLQLKNYCYAIINPSGQVSGVIFVRADLSDINAFMAKNRVVFIQALAIALILTVILAIILARTVTVPINNVTKTVKKMSMGDFSGELSISSDDEIGQLADMFNTLRIRLDETLLEISNEKNKLGTILEYMADGLIAIDLEGNIIHVNPAAREMLGIGQDIDLTQTNYDMLLGNAAKEVSLDHIREDCADDDAGQAVFSINSIIFAARYDHFKDEEGANIGFIIIIQDITERQKLQDMQTEFVANVSHELKTPLTNIKGYTETLIDGAIDDRETAMKFLGIIDSESDRMNRLVKDLLQLSRMDNQQETLNIKETNIVALTDATVTKIAISAQQKNQQLNRLYDKDDNIRVNLDRDRFEQVLVNVISNAIKYTGDGGRIDVDIVRQADTARVIVQDNGIGISQAALPRIFERFYRVDKARSRAMGGTGLGLAITKHIVEEHGGSIEAESQEGKGTKITIIMPLASKKGIRNIE